MRSPVIIIAQFMMGKKCINTKIRVGSVVKAKDGDLVVKTREGRIRRTRKEVGGCVQAMVWKKNFLVKFENRQKKEMGYFSIFCLCSKEEVSLEMDKKISNINETEQGKFFDY